MKKILYLLLLICSFTAIAQSTYSIEKPLKLNNVPRGEASDSVLVRGFDRIVKLVSRDEFSGGNQAKNLQEVIDNGSTWNGVQFVNKQENYNSNHYISSEKSYFSYQGPDSLFTGYTYTSLSGFSNIFYYQGIGKLSQLSATGGLILKTNESENPNATAILKSDLVTEGRILQLPDTSGTLATKIDYNLQSVLANGKEASNTSIKIMSSWTSEESLLYGGGLTSKSGPYSSTLGSFDLTFSNSNSGHFSTISMGNNPIGNPHFFLPDLYSGSHHLVARDELTAGNGTTVALTSSDLNTVYPNAITGFQVECLSITGGPLIYRKTISGWVQYPVTITP